MNTSKNAGSEPRGTRLYGMVDAVEPMNGNWISVQIDAVRVDAFDEAGGNSGKVPESAVFIVRVTSTQARLGRLIEEQDPPILPGDWIEFELADDGEGPRAWFLGIVDGMFGTPAATRVKSMTRLLPFEPQPSPLPRPAGSAVSQAIASNRQKGASLLKAHDLVNLANDLSGKLNERHIKRYIAKIGKKRVISQLSGHGDNGISVNVQDVGQGSYAEIRIGSKTFILFDVGFPIWINVHSKPRDFKPDLEDVVLVVLSHWDIDHYAYGRTSKRLRRQIWLAPAQKVGPAAYNFASHLNENGLLYLIRDSESEPHFWKIIDVLPNYWQIALWRCTGLDLNGSGLALTVQAGDRLLLLPGDANTDQIPFCKTMQFDGLVVPHHGAKLERGKKVIKPKGGSGTAVVSAGKPNRYGHPDRCHLKLLEKNGWRVQATYNDGKAPRGAKAL